MLRGKLIPSIFFISLALFIITLVNDILLANTAGSVSGNYLSQLSFQVFIFAMAVVLIMEWVTNYNKRTQLEASLRFRTKVLSVIAHDLKNPIASIAQFADLLANKPDLSGKKRILDSLNDSSQAALSLLDNLLYWSRSQRDELKLSPVNLEIDKVVAEVESLYAHMAVQKGVSLHAEVFPDTKAFADQVTLTIIIRNLVSNAIKFTPASGAVTIRVQPETDRVRVSVSDTGVGIKPDILETFQAGGQPGSTQGTDREIGTGLGLQLVGDLVKRNGGTLSIESTEGRGSTFSFTLPGKKQNDKE
jgi:signal transduction histidine kinase